ncbi:hypothetical protein EX909_23355 [Salmonella enterica subsp. enterica serovar Litchfield]|nr:hypothetical protein [Salmonella enterica subsp. enterica serovar Typhimurium]ECF0162636.1 hypothetical protein [Salmonella enterica subsp. enterica serovar Litchfield]
MPRSGMEAPAGGEYAPVGEWRRDPAQPVDQQRIAINPRFLVCNRYMVVSYCHMKRSEPVPLPKVIPCFAAYGPSLHLSRQQQS